MVVCAGAGMNSRMVVSHQVVVAGENRMDGGSNNQNRTEQAATGDLPGTK